MSKRDILVEQTQAIVNRHLAEGWRPGQPIMLNAEEQLNCLVVMLNDLRQGLNPQDRIDVVIDEVLANVLAAADMLATTDCAAFLLDSGS